MNLRLLFCCALLLYGPSSFAATLNVCGNCPYSTLHAAIASAHQHDVIRVHPGTYAEGMMVIDKPLTITGIDFPTIDGHHEKHVFYIRADDVTIERLQIQNSGQSDISEYAGIRVEESKRCRILNNRFHDNTYGIYLAKVDTCSVVANTVTGNTLSEVSGGNGLHLWYSTHLTVQDNLFERQRDGMYLEFSGDSLIEDNISRHNIRYGLHFMYSQRNRFYRNTFIENQTGVAVMYSHDIEMAENRFEKSWGATSYGLLLKDINDTRVVRNTFDGNTVAVVLDGANRNRFEHNIFSHNGWAMNVFGNSDGNVISQNNFISNAFHVTTNTKSVQNIFAGNYWDDYRGYDLDHDGVGDVPFRPMKLFSLWIAEHPELVSLMGSPVIEFLETAERVFPVMTPKMLEDHTPQMKRFADL
ncbi:MAG: nitrous oxide reductase family maturation protein NosD [Deltaproteobacteria bacterium]|nr:nitrous oxide reductase family maturation protein NosD [Deltaproteobacteria bacterium]